MKALDLTGQRYGSLTVLKRVPSEDNRSTWLCLCDCGRTRIVSALHLRRKKYPVRTCAHHGKTPSLYERWLNARKAGSQMSFAEFQSLAKTR